jgi:ureidoglycolate hydrolase
MVRKVRMGEELPLELARCAVELFEVAGRDPRPVEMARHVRGPQLIAGMDGRAWGIWVAPPGARPVAPEWVRVEADEAIVIEAGTWHHGPIPEGERGRFLTVEAPGTNVEDFEVGVVNPS